MHRDAHPLAGTFVTLNDVLTKRWQHEISPLIDELANQRVFVVDWYDRATGHSWQDDYTVIGNTYALRGALLNLDENDETVLVTLNDVRHIVHASEIPEAM